MASSRAVTQKEVWDMCTARADCSGVVRTISYPGVVGGPVANPDTEGTCAGFLLPTSNNGRPTYRLVGGVKPSDLVDVGLGKRGFPYSTSTETWLR